MNRTRAALLALVVAGLVVAACGRSDPPAEQGTGVVVARTGGMTTFFDDTERAFSFVARNADHYDRQVFADGDVLFEADLDAAGPVFDSVSCSSCHLNDGRAPGPVAAGPVPHGMIVKLITDDPHLLGTYGGQLQQYTFDGTGDGTVTVAFTELTGELGDGTPYTLRRPTYTFDGELPDDAVLGPRIAPPLPGLGLLELIAAADIESRADPDDADADGISGRVSIVEHRLLHDEQVGRFGWQASTPTVEQQTATALFMDMGVTNLYFPSPDCEFVCNAIGSPADTRYVAVNGGAGVSPDYVPTVSAGEGGYDDGPYPTTWELSDQGLFELTVYTQALAVPAARDVEDPEVLAGAEVFDRIRCSSCHVPGPYTTSSAGQIVGLRDQVVYPFTDLLLHDLGDGLADRTVGGAAVPTEWRTPPLWGLGLTGTVGGHTTFLHDGRARSVTEAILWHGGEAAASQERFAALTRADRDALLRYLDSL